MSDSEHMQMEITLPDRIEAIYLDFPHYSYLWVTKQLQREGAADKPQEGIEINAGKQPSLPG